MDSSTYPSLPHTGSIHSIRRHCVVLRHSHNHSPIIVFPNFLVLVAAGCSVLPTIVDMHPDWICVRLMGIMRGTYVGKEEDREAVEDFLQFYIEEAINGASPSMSSIQAAIFLNSEVQPVDGGAAVTADVKSVETTSSNYVGLASGLSVGAVVAMLLAYFVIARRRRSKETPSVEEGVDKTEIAEGNEVRLQTKTKGSSDEGDMDNDLEVATSGADCVGMSSAPIVLMTGQAPSPAVTEASDSDTSGSRPDPGEDLVQRVVKEPPKSDEFTNVSAASNSEKGPTVMVDINKPPMPPTTRLAKPHAAVPVVSKSLKKRRKRKKMKTKSMKRTNSREKIDGMDTIAEGEEETSGDNNGSDNDSDYSWYSTDENDSESGSRDPSPNRSREVSPAPSPARSREPSPAQSMNSSEASPGRSFVSISSDNENEKLDNRGQLV